MHQPDETPEHNRSRNARVRVKVKNVLCVCVGGEELPLICNVKVKLEAVEVCPSMLIRRGIYSRLRSMRICAASPPN